MKEPSKPIFELGDFTHKIYYYFQEHQPKRMCFHKKKFYNVFWNGEKSKVKIFKVNV